jgi:hypothetical protein
VRGNSGQAKVFLAIIKKFPFLSHRTRMNQTYIYIYIKNAESNKWCNSSIHLRVVLVLVARWFMMMRFITLISGFFFLLVDDVDVAVAVVARVKGTYVL